MRPQHRLLARQLRSAATRYRHDLAREQVRGRPVFVRLGNTATASVGNLPDELAGRGLKMARLEAVLFLAREPLHSRKLSQYADLADGTEARTLARRLNELYDHSGCAFRVEEVAGGMQLRTQIHLADWVSRLQHVPRPIRLSVPAMETLSVVAYRQPVLRADVEAVRGVACGELLRQLMERDLVRIAGRSQELGRPFFYGSTKYFLQVFGLRSLEDLPRFEEFQSFQKD